MNVSTNSCRVGLSGKKLLIHGKLVRTARLEEEWYDDVESPDALEKAIHDSECRADVLTFWQRLPNVEPRFNYCMDHDSIAAIPIKDYAFWWANQIDAKTRNMIRKAEKKGIVVRRSEFDDKFVQGMVSIFNETPVRQGKPFWHYGKDFETVKREFSRFLSREEIFGAYVGDELIGFIFIIWAGKFAALGQIISKIAHRDKAPNNALIAKAVERCSEKGVPYLAYANWVEGSLGEFKRSNGFEKVDLPRYFVPLTWKGRIFVSLRLYRGSSLLPKGVVQFLKDSRKRFNELRTARAGHPPGMEPSSPSRPHG
jgi:hypothetical protein